MRAATSVDIPVNYVNGPQFGLSRSSCDQLTDRIDQEGSFKLYTASGVFVCCFLDLEMGLGKP